MLRGRGDNQSRDCDEYDYKIWVWVVDVVLYHDGGVVCGAGAGGFDVLGGDGKEVSGRHARREWGEAWDDEGGLEEEDDMVGGLLLVDVYGR